MQRTDSLEKNSDAGKDWRWEEKGPTEEEMMNGITCMMDMSLSRLWELVVDREASCCSPWGCKESDMAERPNWNEEP